MAQGYKGFGSFHSDNVEELIANPELVAPDLPADFLPAMPDRSTEMGEKFKSEHFLLDPTWNFVNHGAFGGVCKFAMEVAHRWQVYAERQPLQFIDRELFTHLVYSIKRLAAFVNAPPAQVVLLPNVTTGLNTIAASCGLKEGGAVYMLDIAYGSSKKIFGHHCTEAKAQLILEPVPLPIESEDAIVDLVAATLPENAQLAVFDHITSNTAVTLPVQRLVELCHSRGVPVLIDGAHGLGQLPLDMTAIGADYYLSNGHKWLCCTKGTAFMYVAKEKQAQTLPLIKSHGFGAGFTSNFIWDGCRDYSGALSLPYVLDFWNAIGFDTVRMYSQQILRNAIRQLQEAWGSRLIAPLSMHCQMGLVELPLTLRKTVFGALALRETVLHKPTGEGGQEGTVAARGSGGGSVDDGGRKHLLESQLRKMSESVVAKAVTGEEGGAGEGEETASKGSKTGGTAGGEGGSSPAGKERGSDTGPVMNSTHAKMVQDTLHFKYRTEVPVKCLAGSLWLRLSAAPYNSPIDYDALDESVRALCGLSVYDWVL